MKLAIIAGTRPDAAEAGEKLRALYGSHKTEDADVIVAIGGDGLMLEVLRATMHLAQPVYGLNRGTVGFLMNEFSENNLLERIEQAEHATIHPLQMTATTSDAHTVHEQAINEVSVYRQTRQSAKLRLTVNGKVRMENLVCDGTLLATPAGSTAYNLSAHGPILPLNAQLLALTPISAFRPRRWKGALLPHDAHLQIDVLDPHIRPVSAVADNQEFRDVITVNARADHNTAMTLLFDPGQSLDERILREQFDY